MRASSATYPSWEHYRSEREPRSSGRALLSQALITHTALNWGMSGEDIADAFEPDGSAEDRRNVASAIALFEAPLQDGRFRTWARPFGGGPPEPLMPDDWEVDDLAPRFASSAINLLRRFDADAEPKHWIFVEEAVIDALHALHREDIGMPPRGPAVDMIAPGAAQATYQPVPIRSGDALIRLADVERQVGMKKSTIYARVAEGRFPAPIRNGGRISSWRQAEIAEWIRNPR